MLEALRRVRPGLLVLGLILAGMIAWLVLANKERPRAADSQAPVAVTVTKVVARDFPVVITALGAAQAWQGVTIRSQVSGRLLRVPGQEGAPVKAGQLVAEIDPAPFEAALMQAQGAERRDTATLEQARVDLKRYQTLDAVNAIAKIQLEAQAALVKQLEGTVMIDKGAVETARVNLGYTHIVSPVDGRLGVRLVDAGNLVSPTDATGIISVNQLTPIAVTFTVPQRDFQRLSSASDSFSKPLLTQALSQESGAVLGNGELAVTDNHVDPATGTIQLKARFENGDGKLWPGQFVNVRLTVQTLQNALTVPSAAINQGPNGAYVFIVDKAGSDNRVKVRPVDVSATQDLTAVVRQGLTAGETVVVDGQLSLQPNAKVRIR